MVLHLPYPTQSGQRAAVALLAVAIIAAGVGLAAPQAKAQATTVVINEVHYHPATDPDDLNDIDDLEFLELYNPTATAVSLDGWHIDDAFALTIGSVVIGPGEYVIVSPSATATIAEYGVTPVAEYDGKLSNGGEVVTLLDAADAVVDRVEYDDGGSWPSIADGDGPSLELTSPALDNALASSWAASDPAPTPGALNTALPPSIAIAVPTIQPVAPTDADSVDVSAVIDGAAAPMLTYRVAFGPESTVAMTTAGGGGYTATVPAQAEGELVRYRIDDGAVATPPVDDSITYWGYVVADDDVDTLLPDFRWFIDPVVFDDMLDNHRLDDTLFPTVVAYGGTVYDGVVVRVRGGVFARTMNPKQSFEFEFPDGHDFIAPDILDYPIDQFGMNASWQDRAYGRNRGSWDLHESAGFPKVQQFTAHLEKNGEFYGMFQFTEKLDGQWRDAADLDDGEFYKAESGGFLNDGDWEVKEPDDGTTDQVDAIGAVLRQSSSPAKTQFLYGTFDIPNLVNWMAVSTLVGNWDLRTHNYFVFHDTGDTGRWQIYPWDLDQTLVRSGSLGCSGTNVVDLRCVGNPLIDSVYEVPALEAMVLRRMRTLLDGPMRATLIEDAHDLEVARMANDSALELALWDRFNPMSLSSSFKGDVAFRRDLFENQAAVPASQSAAPTIVINELLPNPADGGAELLELFNPGTTSVDVSGWEIDGTGTIISGGTVIGAGEFLVLTDELALFPTDRLPAGTVVVQYSGGLKGSGETIRLLTPTGTVIDEVTYADVAPWPFVPEGFSYELREVTADNAAATSWGPSMVAGGTAGLTNTPASSVRLAAGSPCAGLTPTHLGTDDDDSVYATNGDDVIFTFGGDDTVFGRQGDDVICTGAGDDRVFAGSGDNIVFGEAGVDKIRAGGGRDQLFGGDDRDFLNGGHGDDRIHGQMGPDRLRGSTGDDDIRGGADDDVLWGGRGDDILRGAGGDDILKGSAGTDTCDGGIGTNIIQASCEL